MIDQVRYYIVSIYIRQVELLMIDLVVYYVVSIYIRQVELLMIDLVGYYVGVGGFVLCGFYFSI